MSEGGIVVLKVWWVENKANKVRMLGYIPDMVVLARYDCGSWKLLEGRACHHRVERLEEVHRLVVVGDVAGDVMCRV